MINKCQPHHALSIATDQYHSDNIHDAIFLDPDALQHLAQARLLPCARRQVASRGSAHRLLTARDDDCVGAHKRFWVSQMRVSQETSADVQMCGERCFHHS